MIPLGNTRGLHVTGGFNLIGGLTPTARNIISGNVNEGIFIATDGQSGNVVEGNFIGTRADGITPLGNGSQGMSVYGVQNCVTIGGTDDCAGNTIAFNGREGIRMPLNFGGVRILRNSIFGNMRLGIDLVGGTEDTSGATANDPGDADTGPNISRTFRCSLPLKGETISFSPEHSTAPPTPPSGSNSSPRRVKTRPATVKVRLSSAGQRSPPTEVGTWTSPARSERLSLPASLSRPRPPTPMAIPRSSAHRC